MDLSILNQCCMQDELMVGYLLEIVPSSTLFGSQAVFALNFSLTFYSNIGRFDLKFINLMY